MLYPEDAPLEEAVESFDQNLGVEVLFDWNRNGLFDHPYSDLSSMVISADLDKSLSGALPPSTPLIEGTSSTELNLVLGGHRTPEEPPANVVFSKYNPESPLYNMTIRNTPVQYSILMDTDDGVRVIRQFTGRVRIAKSSSTDPEVTLSCLDAVEELKKPIGLPAFGSVYDRESGYMFSSHWVMDRVLRESGFYQSWPRHKDACYYATLHGGAAPEVGLSTYATIVQSHDEYRWVGGGSEPMYYDTRGQQFQSVGNTAGIIPRPNVGNTISLSYRFKREAAGQTIVFGQYLNGRPFDIDISAGYTTTSSAAVVLELQNTGKLRIAAQNSYNGASFYKTLVSTQTITDSIWHTVQGEVTFNSSSITLRLRLDNGTWQTSTLTGAFPPITAAAPFPPFPYIEWPLMAQLSTYTPVTNIQVTCGTDSMLDIFPSDFVPSVRLDQGHNRLTAVPEFVETPAWDILKELASTEFGSLYVDEYGVVRFDNMHTSRIAEGTPDRIIGAEKLTNLSITDATDNVINTVYGKVRPYRIGLSSIWDASKEVVIYDKSGTFPEQITFSHLDDFTIQPSVNAKPTVFWPEVRGMLWPNTIGRNVVPYYPPSDWKDDDEILQGIGAIHATNGTAPSSDRLPTVDVWPDTQNSLYIAVFNQPNNSLPGRYAVQLSNGIIDDQHAPGSSRDSETLKYTLKIAGSILFEQPDVPYTRRDASSIDEHGYRPYEIPATEWTQSFAAMTYIADELLSDMAFNPIPLVEDITIPGDPRIQLGSTLELEDAGALGGSLRALVTGIRRSLSADGFEDSYSMKLIYRPASWLLGDSTYSVLGQTTILTP